MTRFGTLPSAARLSRLIFPALLIGYAIYALAFILRTTIDYSGHRWFVLFDDAMISMRYARNFVTGHGLVWNPGGPRVEGFTNPLWVFFMAVVHLLPLGSAYASLPVQLAALVLRLAEIVLTRKLALQVLPRGVSPHFATFAAGIDAFYYPLNFWALEGMESALLCPLLLLSALLSVDDSNPDQLPNACFRRSVAVYALLSVGTFTRLDMVVPYIVFFGWRIAVAPARHRKSELLLGSAVLLLSLFAQTIARLLYYGEYLPNTYYLKVTGYPVMLRIGYGITALLDFFQQGFYLLPVVCGWAIFSARKTKLSSDSISKQHRLFFALLLIAQCAYSAYVGGDAWEKELPGSNRFISVAMGFYFILLAEFAAAAGNLCSIAARGMRHDVSEYSRNNLALALQCFPAAFIVLLLVGFDPRAWRVPQPVHWRTNANYLKVAESLRVLLRDVSDPHIGVTSAGVLPYFADFTCIDFLGKNDKFIARKQCHLDPKSGNWPPFHSGHMKWDNAYTIGVQRPLIAVSPWTPYFEDLKELNAGYTKTKYYGLTIYVRNDFWPSWTAAVIGTSD